MYRYENTPSEWFSLGRRGRSRYCPSQISRPVSKSFNRISDFIFPDTVHLHFARRNQRQQQQQHSNFRGYQRTENYSLPALNRKNRHQPDLVIVERLPADEFDNVDLLYREQNHQSNRSIRRHCPSITNERRAASNEKTTSGLASRSSGFREKIRDRRKRHTTDNVYHSMLKSMLDVDDQQQYTNGKGPNYILSYTTTLDAITDSESMASMHQQKQQHVNDISHYRVPINGTVPIMSDHSRPRHRQRSSTISSRGSSSDTDTTDGHPTTTDYNHNLENTSYISSSNVCRTLWDRLPHQPDEFIPINSSMADTNNHEVTSYSNLINSSPFDNIHNYRTNNQTTSQDATHHVSVCVNDLHTTLYIDEDTLNHTKTTISNDSNGGKAVIKTFIDRIIKRLQHFKRSLDNGLIHVRKRNALVNGTIVSSAYPSHSETIKRKIHIDPSLSSLDENKLVRPYFLIKPQTVLMLPNETAKFKCCFGGDPLPNLIWSHNDFRIPETLVTSETTSSKYRTHKLHDIYYLDIASISLRDNGQVKCTIMNTFGRDEAIVRLFVVPSPADATPYITQPLNDIVIVEGQPLKLSCGIHGLQVAVSWFHNGKLFSSAQQSKSDYNDENAIFTLYCCLRTDAGTIDCLVKNRFGEARTSCQIEVVNDAGFDRCIS